MKHKFVPETTNGGNVFCDCACGWSGGVYPSRAVASVAWGAHKRGLPNPVDPQKARPILLFGDPPRGMTDDNRD